MAANTDLTLYLLDSPEQEELKEFMSMWGFTHVKDTHKITPKDKEPPTSHFLWKLPRLSGYGFYLVHHYHPYHDDNHRHKYKSFILISARPDSSVVDLTMIDVISSMLILKYGGIIHNHAYIGTENTNRFLSGVNVIKT
jgi:hypothetical protein